MAENEPLTPEKQLLKLIENPKRETLAGANVKRQGRKWFSLGAMKGRFAFWKTFSFGQLKGFQLMTKSSLGLRQINLLLKITIVFLVIYLGYSMVVMAIDVKKASNFIFEPVKTAPAAAGDEAISFLKELPYYIEKVTKRDLFRLEEGQEAKEAWTPPVEEGPSPVELMTKRLSLVGISWGSDPEAMVEDTQDQKTYFVKRGQLFGDSIKVVAIFKDRVVLGYQNEEIELV